METRVSLDEVDLTGYLPIGFLSIMELGGRSPPLMVLMEGLRLKDTNAHRDLTLDLLLNRPIDRNQSPRSTESQCLC